MEEETEKLPSPGSKTFQYPNNSDKASWPTGYWLDAQKVRNLPRVRVSRTPEGNKQEVPTTIGEVLESLTGHQIMDLDGAFFNRYLLEALLDLQKNDINGFLATWFWYDSEVGGDSPGSKAYDFFVVHEDRIVRDRVVLFDELDNEFPSVFRNDDSLPAIWGNWKAFDEANIRFWYRKFYQETVAGQLMVLRPDEPELYYYPEGRWRLDKSLTLVQDGLANISSGLGKIRFLLWVLVALVLFVVFLLWR